MCLFRRFGQAHGVESQAESTRPAEENQLGPIHTQSHRFVHGGLWPEGGNFIRKGQNSCSYFQLPQRNQLLQLNRLPSPQQEQNNQNEITIAQPYHIKTRSSSRHLQGHHHFPQSDWNTERIRRKWNIGQNLQISAQQ